MCYGVPLLSGICELVPLLFSAIILVPVMVSRRACLKPGPINPNSNVCFLIRAISSQLGAAESIYKLKPNLARTTSTVEMIYQGLATMSEICFLLI
jgi:hypothetical protein